MNNLAHSIEGLLFALGKPLSRKELLRMLDADTQSLEDAIAILAAKQGGVAVVDDGVTLELRVAPSVAATIEKVRREEYVRDIGRAGLEVLAAIIYRGPLSRAEIDFIRGVNSSQTIRTLTMRGLIRRTQNPKDERSFLYEATTELFASLSITHAHDLPEYEQVRNTLSTLEATYKETSTPSEA